ncbi:MAG: glycoside hydrolase family 38 C-terminal domain-containing protein [Ferruginibacter sp.]
MMNKKESVGRGKFIASMAVGVLGTLESSAFLTAFSTKGNLGLNALLRPGNALPRDTFHVIPHNHWEGAVFATREAYLEMGLPHIVTALKLLRDYPEYRFTLDQVNYIRPFIERYEEEGKAFRQFVAEGRLQIVGGTDSMHDTNMPSGESIVRQILYGKTYLRKELGVDVKVGWGIDTFGHSAQMPQILKLAGYHSLWFVRGVPNRQMPSEFFWEGLDGTKLPAFWLPHSYVIMARVPNNINDFNTFVKKKFDSLTANSGGGKDRVGLAGWDVENPQEHLPVMIKEFNRQQDPPFNLQFAVPTEYEATIAKRNDRTIFKGEFNPIFQGVYSSRIELKQKLRNVERILLNAEKLGAINNLLGKPTEDKDVWKAWEPSLFNQAHDLMSGVMTDHVYADTIRGYDFSQQVGEELVEHRLDDMVSMIDTGGGEIPLVVYNLLAWQRTDVVETNIAFAKGGVIDIEVVGPDGNAIPVEVLSAERYDDGALRTARIIFIAKDLPALGYTVFHVNPLKAASSLNMALKENSETTFIENNFYKVSFDMYSGAMTSLLVKEDQWEVLSGAGNVVARQYDGGDFWELYQNLRDGMVAKTTTQTPPTDFKERLSKENQYRGEIGKIHQGPVYAEFSVKHGFSTDNQFETRVRLYAGIRRVDINTKIYNIEKYVRYQVMFPTTISQGINVHEIPFGAIERPLAIEFPAQNWADYSDGKRGLALLNHGLPGNLTSGSTMMLSLLRSAKIENYGYGGGYEKWMTSDTGLQMHRSFSFDYSLVPHQGDWREAGVYKDGLEFNNALVCHKTGIHKGKLPKKWSLLEVSHQNAVITSVKPGPGGSTIVRFYEASGNATKGITLKTKLSLKSAHEANLMEDVIKATKTAGSALRFDLAAFEIKTFRLQFKTV